MMEKFLGSSSRGALAGSASSRGCDAVLFVVSM
jgi:hypothetical protein